MFSFTQPTVEAAEAIADQTDNLSLALKKLRELPLDDFGILLMEMPNATFPALSRILPRMASSEVQNSWTGSNGYVLLRQTLTFVRLLEKNVLELRRRPLADQRMLDFGCGWGRIIRLMYYFADPEKLYCCDPWDRSIEICKRDGISANLAISDYLPKSLPFGDTSFDLIFAFSVFTHLSERAAADALKALCGRLAPEGLLVITIRPVEYWSIHAGLSVQEIASLQASHTNKGFAFRPHDRAPVDGDVTYGDTSASLEYFAKKVPALKLRKLEHSLDDPYQLILYLSH